MAESLHVSLGDEIVGTLTRLPGSQVFFGFDDAYISNPNRPVLSQFYLSAVGELRPEERPSRNGRLPHWFCNLLPEGPLRTYLANRGQVRPGAEFDLLSVLADDLPGAVRITSDDDKAIADEQPEAKEITAHEGPLRFSLAGVQLKFSGIVGKHGGLTIPASGSGGDWIVKLPSAIYPTVPENEETMLTLASQIGLEVPAHRLVHIADIEGLPELGSFSDKNALAVKRFDRRPDGLRIHIEDLAQVFGVMPEDKYEGVGFVRIAELIALVMGSAAVQDFVTRLAFMVLTGNGDMHLKNWSLIYPDGRTPALAPAYDLVSTIPYIPTDRLALNLAGKKAFSDINRDRFVRLAQKAQISERETLLTLERTVELTVAAWREVKVDTVVDEEMVTAIDQHMQVAAKRLR